MKQIPIQAMAISSSVLWASAFLAGKYALQYYTPLRLAGLRLLFAGVLLLLLLRKNPLKSVRGYLKWIFLLSLFQTIILFSAFNYGLSRVSGSFGAVIIGSAPAVTSLISIIFLRDEHMTTRKMLGLIIGVTGIIVLAFSREPWTPQGKQEIIGAAFLLLCNVSTAVGNIIMKKRLHTLEALPVNTVQILFGGVIVISLSYIFEPIGFRHLQFLHISSILYLSFISAAAVTMWLHVIKQTYIRISSVVMWKFLIPSLGSVFSWLFIPEEKPEMVMVLAIAAVVAAVLLTVSEGDTKVVSQFEPGDKTRIKGVEGNEI